MRVCAPFLAVGLRMNAELMPVGLGKIDVVEARRLLDVRESYFAVGIGYVDDLIEARDSIPDMGSVSQRLFPLLGKREHSVRQRASRGELTVLFVRLPGRLCGCHGKTSIS
jgi:hypothetical protein